MELDATFQVLSLTGLFLALVAIERRRLSPSTGVVVGLGASLFFATLFVRDSFHLMRLVAWVVFLHIPVILIVYGFLHRRQRGRLVAAIVIVALLLGIAVDAFLVEPHRLETTTHRISVPGLSAPVRIVVLADIQTDEVGPYEREVFSRVAHIEPDLVLLPGDFLQVYGSARPEQVRLLRQLMGTLSPRLGTWAVPGNVDPPNADEIFRGTGVRYLERTRGVEVSEEISLIGLSLNDSFNESFRLPPTESVLRIVMGHAPDFSLGTSDDGGTNLYAAGHTHGGQVQLPIFGPPLTLSQVPRTWGRGGLVRLSEQRSLIVSRGIGMERGRAPRLRFLCRPELVVVELEPAP